MFNPDEKKPELRIAEDPFASSSEPLSIPPALPPAFSRSRELFRRRTLDRDGADIPVPDLWQHPLLSIYGEDVLTNTLNWRSESRVDVLTISGKDGHVCKFIRLRELGL